jgi:hypothetical protein
MVIPLWLRMTAAIGILSIANIAEAYERPVLILSGLGAGGAGAKVINSSNLSMMGRIEPSIQGGVEIRLFSILENGDLHQIGGTTAQINETGTFAVSIFPPKAGWPLGKVRAKVTFSPIRQVKAETEFEIVVRKDVPPFSFEEDKPPLDIGRILEMADTRGKTIKVPAHSRFFIRGTVDKPNKKFISENGLTGPPVFGDVVTKEKKTSFFQSITISLAETDRKGVYSYEWEVVSPHKAGLYEVRLTPMDEAEEYKKVRTREEPDFMLEVEGNVDLSR